MKISSICKFLILGVIVLTPIFNFGEVFALLSGNMVRGSQSLTSVYVKFLKDFVFLLLIFIGSLSMLVSRKLIASKYYIAFIFLAVSAIIVSSAGGIDKTVLLAGIRWILPLFLILFIYKAVDTDLQARISTVVNILALLAFIIQIFQLFFMQRWYGSFMGLSLRNPGFFFIPSSMAMFTLISMYYASNFMRKSLLRNILLYAIFPASIILTGSGTGVIAMLLFFFVSALFVWREKWLVLIVFFAVIAVFLVNLPGITNRPDIYTSIYERMDIFSSSIGPEKIILSDSFGEATNTIMNIGRYDIGNDSGGFIADSTITSVMYNVGIFPVLVFAVFLFSYFRWEKMNMQFWAVYIPFIITIIIFELFPINLLFAVNIAYFHKLIYQKGSVTQTDEKQKN